MFQQSMNDDVIVVVS